MGIRGVLFVFIILSFCSLPSNAMFRGKQTSDTRFDSVIAIQECSAIVVMPTLILTAAHCLLQDSGPFKLWYSTSNREVSKIVPAEKAVRHNLFTLNSSQYDIALILLKNPLPEPNVLTNIPKIQIPNIITDKFVGVGFGDFMKKRTIVDDSYRNSLKRFLPFTFFAFSPGVLITSAKILGSGSCHGDSGGGMFNDHSLNQTPNLIGILASIAMPECWDPKNITRAVMISEHLQWIKNNSGIDLTPQLVTPTAPVL